MKVADSIIEEVRTAREAIAERSGDTLEEIVEAARRRQSSEGRRVIMLPAKRAESTRRAS